MQKTKDMRVRSLGWKRPLEKKVATHSSTLAWKIPWTEEPGGQYSSWGRKESDMTERSLSLSHTHTYTYSDSSNHNIELTRIIKVIPSK